MNLRVGVINVPRGVGRKAWARCFRLLMARADIGGINEALTPGQKAVYRVLALRLRLAVFGLFGPNPLFARKKKWKRLHGRQYILHGRGPLYRRWPGFNSGRAATVAVYRHRRTRLQVAVINTHWAPRGPKVPQRWRDWARQRSTALATRIVAAHLAKGRVVVLLGDFNMDAAPAIPGVTWVVGARHGVDKIGVAVPKGWRIAERTTQRFPAPTDHRSGVAADLRIERA